MKKAVLYLKGAHCPSCVYAIQRNGSKVEGVQKCEVSDDKNEIHVVYEGNPGSLERIVEIVHMLGYDAEIRWDTVEEVERQQ